MSDPYIKLNTLLSARGYDKGMYFTHEECTVLFSLINSRPLEDALLARAECAEADANRLAKLLVQQQNRVKQAEQMVERLIECGNTLAKTNAYIETLFSDVDESLKNWRALVAEWQKEQK